MRNMIGVVVVAVLLSACSEEPIISASECVNALSEKEQQQQWTLLFDGVSLDQWRSWGEPELNSGWAAENGCLTRVGRGGEIITRKQYGDFELKLEWRINTAGNSGIFIRGDEAGRNIHHSGFEMQILDNVGHSDSEDPTHRAGALYDLVAPAMDTTRPPLTWNRVHIVAKGNWLEFWLNGERTVAIEQGGEEWQARYAASKFTDRERYGTLLRGHIGFQDHWDKVWFRNIRVREL